MVKFCLACPKNEVAIIGDTLYTIKWQYLPQSLDGKDYVSLDDINCKFTIHVLSIHVFMFSPMFVLIFFFQILAHISGNAKTCWWYCYFSIPFFCLFFFILDNECLYIYIRKVLQLFHSGFKKLICVPQHTNCNVNVPKWYIIIWWNTFKVS